jgi:hypothetical protein
MGCGYGGDDDGISKGIRGGELPGEGDPCGDRSARQSVKSSSALAFFYINK